VILYAQLLKRAELLFKSSFVNSKEFSESF